MKFKTGDRVRCYGAYNEVLEVLVGTVERVEENGLLYLNVKVSKVESIGQYSHPKQCRKLVKKERRRVWLHCYEDGSGSPTKELHPDGTPCGFCREFVEVRRKGEQ